MASSSGPGLSSQSAPSPSPSSPSPSPSSSSSTLHETLITQTKAQYANIQNITNKASEISIDMKNKAITTIQQHTGLDITTSEIANHYLDGLKYGLAGTSGSCLGNYCQYYQNNHDLLAICCANPLNPYNKVNRFLSFWSKTCLAFLLFAVFVYFHIRSIYEFIIVLLITIPYGYFLDSMATCSHFYRSNYFVKCFHSIGFSILLLTSILNLISLAIGIAILIVTKPNFSHFITQFLLSIVFDQLKPLYLGIFNWILHSWKGCLCLPQISCCRSSPCPPRICPLLGLFPIRILLNMYNLGESTYHEDKEEFQENYPDRIAIDRFKPGAERNTASILQSERRDEKNV